MQIRHEHANVGVHFDMHGEPLKPIPKTFHGLQFLVAINWQTYKKRAGKSPCLITRWSKPMWLTLPIDLTLQFGGLNQCPSPYGSSSLVNAFLMKTKSTATSSWKTLHWLKNASFSSQNQILHGKNQNTNLVVQPMVVVQSYMFQCKTSAPTQSHERLTSE